ncbi:hypothetical protein TrRE_jg10694 [Triparma retinervis]|uniref:Cytochrome P450 n=1 Tax=Triparma retinervis TaxID=2557542 RepID=A0A9W7A5A9_9STRA|nr:hypothetical protein TrRE_jg10694 [Triparma retinervis]
MPVDTIIAGLLHNSGSNHIYAVVAALLLAIFVTNAVRKKKTKGFEAPRVEGGWPLIGHAIEYGTNPYAFVERCRKQYGRAFIARIAFKDICFLDGTYSKSFFGKQEKELSFSEAMRQTLVPDLTIGAHVIDSPFHIPILRVSLGAKNVANHYALGLELPFRRSLKKSLGDFADAQSGSKKIMDSPSMLCWNMVAHFSSMSFFGEYMCKDNDELLGIFVSLHLSCFKVINAAAVMPKFIAKWAATDISAKKKAIRRMVSAEVRRRRENPESIVDGSDVLSNVLKAKDPKTGEQPTADKIGDYMISVIFASMSTTAGVLTHVVFDIAGRPNFAKRLRDETAKALKEGGGKVDAKFMERTPNLTAFVRESVRLASLPIQGVRWSVKDTLVKDILIPKNTLVTNSGILAHYDETVFENPMDFDPQRFLEDGVKLIEDPSKLGFSPFGTGRHVCPGRHFAMAEVHVGVALLLQEFSWKTVSGDVPKYKFVATETLRFDEDIEFTKL